ncbi:glycoside hydrolase family 15 protein [Candidatus Parcubacteria bacterium]|nr:MAG: glycoside hydrolase family 15 protein [Candidatus Parcubacteria bacterium]
MFGSDDDLRLRKRLRKILHIPSDVWMKLENVTFALISEYHHSVWRFKFHHPFDCIMKYPMSRSIILSNGELAVALDSSGLVRDLYYPYVGYEDHVRGHYIHRVGVWVDGRISWLGDSGWEITVACEEEALASKIHAKHAGLEVELSFTDIVYNEKPVFIRKVIATNNADRPREIKLYFGHQFEIYKAHGGDTAYFDPIEHALIHYKGRRVFLIDASIGGEKFQDYVTGIANFAGHEGSHRDAEDGVLSKNPIEHGPADSALGLYGTYQHKELRTSYYYIIAATSISEAQELHKYVIEKTPEHLVRSTSDFWRAWISSYDWNFHNLTPEHIALFKRSLLYVRAHVDSHGGVLASLDSDMLNYGLDTYCYVWPRDAAYTAMTLDAAGDTNVAKRFFEFCCSAISKEGYLLHKYLPDGSLGSSWHPWIKNGQLQLPIQEDETALVMIALAEHYRHSKDLEFLESMFNSLIERPAAFMMKYRDSKTGLPEASYDLWEEKRGVSTYTAAAVYRALLAASEMADVLGKTEEERKYKQAASEIKKGILEHLWDEKRGVFYKMLSRTEAETLIDHTVDMSSAYGIFAFGVLPPDDPKLATAFKNSVEVLSSGIQTGGIARYEADEYYRGGKDFPGNPWIVTTLWHAEYLIASAKDEKDFDKVRDIFSWVAKHALASGVLPEQLGAREGEALSATPLTWSHAGYVSAVLKYLDRLDELGLCKNCNPVP